MSDPSAAGGQSKTAEGAAAAACGAAARKEKRKAVKKLKRKQVRREAAIREREEEEERSNDPEEQLRFRLREQEEAEIAERERKAFEERERFWLEAAAARKAAEEEEESRRKKLLEESREKENQQKERADELEEGDEWEYVEEGPAEIIWQGNEITVKKKRVRVAKKGADRQPIKEDDERPTSNPLPPQYVAFASYKNGPSMSAQKVLDKAAQQIPNFGTEQDKAHCPFHLKTGACRFGSRCSRVHFHPDNSCTLLIKNMYSGPGLAWEQDEGLEYTDEEVEHCYEEFYEDVHTEFLKFGELVNFKVCRNGSHHLRGNVYVHYKSLDSALLAYTNMNGRYYAGKQIICEFVAITRWKVAICGEYMKSRLKTCSHGTACNFIHCFRNPGGDYEWADWDNPPPKYWIKNMAALFGHSDESVYDKQVELEDRKKSRGSNRKKIPTDNSRRHSRSSIDCETDMRGGGSIREDPDIERDEYRRHSIRREHSNRRRKEIAFLDEHEPSEENKSEVRYYLSCHDSDEGISKTTDIDFLERHWKYEEKNGFDYHYKRKPTTEDLSRKERGTYSTGLSKSEKHHKSKSHETHKKEHGSSNWQWGNDSNNREPSKNLSSENTGGGLTIDEERYNGGYCSDDVGSNRDSSSVHGTKKDKRLSEKREYYQYNSQHQKSHKSHKYESDDENSKLRKQRTGSQRDYFDDSADDWRSTDKNSDQEDTDHHLPSNSSEFYRKHSRSGGKRKHHQRKDEYRKNGGEISTSDSDGAELNRRPYKKNSRSRTPIQCSGSLKRDSSH
ncbi:zinc finger CCCH domain-containing protein 16 [Phoenix dactylifera]|uniref:Zinc finger CCCH domain-containing protein 16 n=1 Tax=Phoenix dactylifera TaxID=42345 RepID=A0A8B7BVT8_PHODC|nr:zinc finger CCCH domain-containing protein 16 [Phoenix dactylifera]